MSHFPPVDGMTAKPAYVRDSELMGGMWLGCVTWAASQPSLIEDFQAKTGYDFSALKSRGFDALIDEATGRTKATLAAWCDYVTLEIWGVEGYEEGDAT